MSCRIVRPVAPSLWDNLLSPLLTAAGVVILLSLAAGGQSTAGRILGTVTDASGAAVGGATVVVTDAARGTTRNLTTDAAGAYVAPDLEPGIYKIRVESKGFKTVERPNVPIEVATDVRADFALQPGEVSQVKQEAYSFVIYKVEAKRKLPREQVREEIVAEVAKVKLRKALDSITANVSAEWNEKYLAPDSAR